jgi:hypothetical protein
MINKSTWSEMENIKSNRKSIPWIALPLQIDCTT